MCENEPTKVGMHSTDDCDVYVGRGEDQASMNDVEPPVRGWLGNPYPESEYGREGCIERFRKDFEQRLLEGEFFRVCVGRLAGKTLGCWCQRLDDDGPACHGEVIAEWADRLAAWREKGLDSGEVAQRIQDHSQVA
jgi:hypothetical protein